MRRKYLAPAVLTTLLGTSMSATAQHEEHAHHDDHALMNLAPAGLPEQPGDGAFAAIAEIVALLSSDPDTDWSRVDIDALRRHLVDMHFLLTEAQVNAEELPKGLRLRIETTGRGGEAASRMVPAHGPVLAAETGWNSDLARDGDILVWTVTSDDDLGAEPIRALGFFGLMAIGDHHRAHHLAIATGKMAH